MRERLDMHSSGRNQFRNPQVSFTPWLQPGVCDDGLMTETV